MSIFPGDSRVGRSLVALFLLGALLGACSQEEGLELELLPACEGYGQVDWESCEEISLRAWSDGQEGMSVANCDPASGSCRIDRGDFKGDLRQIDALCMDGSEAIGWANSGPIRETMDELAGQTLQLLYGPVNHFVPPTHKRRTVMKSVGDCSSPEEGRFGHTATLLQDGRVLIVGGMKRDNQDRAIPLATAEIFDPATGEHQPLLDTDGSPLILQATSGRAFHTATLLNDGRVLIAGGVGMELDTLEAKRSSEVFDPGLGEFTSPGDIGSARAHHTATLLATGEVLLTGGVSYTGGQIDESAYYDSAAVYDPQAGSWSAAGSAMSTARAFHRAVLLNQDTNFKVLILGGENQSGMLDTADIYDPAANIFFSEVDVQMGQARSRFCALLLPNGEVMVAGGSDTPGALNPMDGVEYFNLGAGGNFGSFLPEIVHLSQARIGPSCTLLNNGSVLVAGGLLSDGNGTGEGELVNGQSGVHTPILLDDDMFPPRFAHRATLLPDGWVYFSGGLQSDGETENAIDQPLLFIPQP